MKANHVGDHLTLDRIMWTEHLISDTWKAKWSQCQVWRMRSHSRIWMYPSLHSSGLIMEMKTSHSYSKNTQIQTSMDSSSSSFLRIIGSSLIRVSSLTHPSMICRSQHHQRIISIFPIIPKVCKVSKVFKGQMHGIHSHQSLVSLPLGKRNCILGRTIWSRLRVNGSSKWLRIMEERIWKDCSIREH